MCKIIIDILLNLLRPAMMVNKTHFVYLDNVVQDGVKSETIVKIWRKGTAAPKLFPFVSENFISPIIVTDFLTVSIYRALLSISSFLILYRIIALTSILNMFSTKNLLRMRPFYIFGIRVSFHNFPKKLYNH